MRNRKHTNRTAINIKVDKIIKGRPHRKCPACKLMKDLDDFGIRFMNRPDGTQECQAQARCRDCR